ncbi:hypothetical protein COB11_04665 [Candidatus Aerophobetes bacterium]|uniref:DUF7336 domain-containing protein n=1 Tax=Aerophobetes bacterium TaxID=2030807 RepID=A0A2A4YH05_UNCAE|nr:MAG: hypothetical protein COB11_04665 [Candidatus Aerophobetes bacterium]
MGIEKSEKVYVLAHEYEDENGYREYKLIAVFSSKILLEKTLAEHKNKTGFRDYPNGFLVEEYLIDNIDKKKFREFLQTKRF